MNTVTTSNATEAAKEAKSRIASEFGPSSVRRSMSIGKLAAALCKAQGEMKNPPKDSVNPHFKSKYADLATVRDTVMPALVKHGLSVVQLPCELDAGAALTTILMHDSGEYVETTMLLRPSKGDPQGVGSALTYARRYALQSIAGVAADEDDDGTAASRPAAQQQRQPPREDATSAVKDNLQLRAKHAQAYGQCKSHAEYLAARKGVVADVEKKILSPADVEALRKVDTETVTKFPAPAKV